MNISRLHETNQIKINGVIVTVGEAMASKSMPTLTALKSPSYC
jgi:hypothetical protein